MTTKVRPAAELTTVRSEIVSPEEFQRLVRESPHVIAKSRFMAPQIGRRDFGRFEVIYSVPMLRRVHAR